MSALRARPNRRASEPASPPYPSWSAVAEITGACGRQLAPDTQAMKEERIWRALADEPAFNASDTSAAAEIRFIEL